MRRKIAALAVMLGAIGIAAAVTARIRAADGRAESGVLSPDAVAAFRAFCSDHCRR